MGSDILRWQCEIFHCKSGIHIQINQKMKRGKCMRKFGFYLLGKYDDCKMIVFPEQGSELFVASSKSNLG